MRRSPGRLVRRALDVVHHVTRPPEVPRTAAHDAWLAADGDRTLRLEYDDLDSESVVCDVGGYEGDWAVNIFARHACRVEVFEPLPANADVIERRFARNPRVTLHRYGLGAESGSVVMSAAGDASSTVVQQPAGAEVEVEIRAVAEVLEGLGVEQVDLMKINIEGAEYDLVQALADSGWIGRIRDLQVQFHDFVPDAHQRLPRIHARLEQTHHLTYHFPFLWENWRRSA